MQVRFWAATDVGRTREHNEDNFLVDKKLNLFIVADGMGGHAAGEVASSVAVREVRRLISEHRETIENYAREESPGGRQEVLRLIETAIQQACARIFEMAQESTERRGMGTTLCMLIVAGSRGFLGHVGDSRIYLLRHQQVHQLTEDHSLVNELIKRGRLKPGDVFGSPYKNAVTRAVGVYETVEVDTLDFDILPGDSYLLCSDGLSCYLDNETTREILGSDDVKLIPDRFIHLANEAGGKDNITSIVVRVEPDAQGETNERMSEVRLKLDTLRAIPLFKYLSYKGLVKVMNITDVRRAKALEVVFEEGDRGEEFYLILSGKIVIEKAGVALAELGPGGHFGEMAMVDKSPRSASVHALEDSKLLIIQRAQFYEIMRRDPNVAVKLMWSFIQVLAARLRLTNDELLSARETIDLLRHNQIGGLVAELSTFDPAILAVSALPVALTDELMPEFLFTDTEQPQTDPLIRLDAVGPSSGKEGQVEPPALPYAVTEAPQTLALAQGADSEEVDHIASMPPDAYRAEEDPQDSAPPAPQAPDERRTISETPALPLLSPPPIDEFDGRATIDLGRRPKLIAGEFADESGED